MSSRYTHLRRYYAAAVLHKDVARRVRWRTVDGQLLRFQVLLEVIHAEDHPVSILDVGCGCGTLYGYLLATGRLGGYLGIDLLPNMINEAQASYPEGRFEVADLLTFKTREQFDLVLCSGALNVVVDDHARWLRDMIKAMWDRAVLAVAFNVLTTRSYRFNPDARGDTALYYADPAFILQQCETWTPWVTMRQDYLGTEASFYLYKGYHRAIRPMQRDRSYDTRSERDQACGLAYLLLERRLAKEALAVLEKLELDADVLNYRGLCYHRLGDHEKAKESYSAALEIDPHHLDAMMNLEWFDKK